MSDKVQNQASTIPEVEIKNKFVRPNAVLRKSAAVYDVNAFA